MSEHLLSVKDLHTSFTTDNGEVHAVNGVSFNLDAGKVLGIVGESGSGKSVTAYSIMQILADNGRITGGSVEYKGEDITKWNKKQMAAFRGKCCSIIFQDPMTSLNPLQTIGRQIEEAVVLHQGLKGEAAKKAPVSNLIPLIIEAVGGADNIKSAEACFTRLRLQLNDCSKVADDKVFTDELEARGIVHVAGGVQIVYGQMASNYATQMRETLGME